MHIVVIPGSNYNNAPAGFSAAVDYVVNLFDNLYTANVTVYINVDYGQIDSTNASAATRQKQLEPQYFQLQHR